MDISTKIVTLIIGLLAAIAGGLIKKGIVNLTDNTKRNDEFGWTLIIIGIIVILVGLVFFIIVP